MNLLSSRHLGCLGLLMLGLLANCSRVVSSKQLLQYALDPKNGLYQKANRNGILVEVFYKPHQLIMAQEIKGARWTTSQLDSINKHFSEYDYFVLRLSRNGQEIERSYAGDEAEFNKVNSYLSFEIGNDITLTLSQDTFKVKDFIHTRTFGSGPSSDILFAFKSNLAQSKGTVKFIFDDSQFNSGRNEFDFAISDIKSTPVITLKQEKL